MVPSLNIMVSLLKDIAYISSLINLFVKDSFLVIDDSSFWPNLATAFPWARAAWVISSERRSANRRWRRAKATECSAASERVMPRNAISAALKIGRSSIWLKLHCPECNERIELILTLLLIASPPLSCDKEHDSFNSYKVKDAVNADADPSYARRAVFSCEPRLGSRVRVKRFCPLCPPIRVLLISFLHAGKLA